MANMASTAAGVAIGSAVGHTISGALLGGGGHAQQPQPVQEQQQQPAYQQPAYQQPAYGQASEQQQQQGPCAFELKQFIECSQTQHDITLCQGFNEALKQCRLNYGMLATHLDQNS